MASMQNIDATVSFWATAPPTNFTAVCQSEIPRMAKSPFSSMRLSTVDEMKVAMPKKRDKNRPVFDEAVA